MACLHNSNISLAVITDVGADVWQQLDLLGPVSPTTVNFNRRFSPHFNLQLA